MSIPVNTWVPLLQSRWRQGRRLFDARLINERRLLIVALVALVWFVLDTTLVTPSFKSFHTAVSRAKKATAEQAQLESDVLRHKTNMSLKEEEARREILRIQERIEHSKQALAQQQAMLAPAREMRTLLEGLLAQNGRVRLRSMRTMAPQEVKFQPLPGVSISQALLYRQGMEVAVEGSYLELLGWLRSIEELPRKLLWDAMTLRADEQSRLTLTLTVHTFSPDRDALEMAP